MLRRKGERERLREREQTKEITGYSILLFEY